MEKQDTLKQGYITAKDGTKIAYDRQGKGPAVILVGGGLVDRSENTPLATELAHYFTVYNYDRRGRGKSGDTLPYALQREIEDIDALISEAGGSAHLYGVSSGGALVLEAAAGLSGINKIAVYEVPYNMAEDWPKKWNEYAQKIETVLAKDQRGEALTLFMRLTGSSEQDVKGLKSSPYWHPMEALAYTLAYDAACLGNGQPSAKRFAKIKQPTLVATGTDMRMPGAAAWVLALDAAADAIVSSIPHAKRQIFEGQSHVAEPNVVASKLKDFFSA